MKIDSELKQRMAASWVIDFLCQSRADLGKQNQITEALFEHERMIENCDICVRDSCGIKNFGFPSSVAQYIVENEANFMSNQLLYTQATANTANTGNPTEMEHVISAIKILLAAMHESVKMAYSRETPFEEIIDLMFESIDFPYMENFPMMLLQSKTTQLKWGITFGMMGNTFIPIAPVIFVPYYGNIIVMCTPDPASHAVSLVFKDVENLNETITKIKHDENVLRNEFAGSVDMEMEDFCVTSGIGTQYSHDFVVIPPHGVGAPVHPLVNVMTNCLLSSMMLPTLVALDQSAETKDWKMRIKFARAILQKHLSIDQSFAPIWGG